MNDGMEIVNTKDLLIYHPGTGTVISLRDLVYLIDASELDEETLDELEMGGYVAPQFHNGIVLAMATLEGLC